MSKYENNSRGVTLITLIITLVIIVILVTTIGYNVLNRNTMTKLDDLYSDLTLIEEKYKTYYAQKGYVPLENKHENVEEILEKINEVRNPNDSDEYYYINNNISGTNTTISTSLGDIKLNNNGDFIINEKTLTVYYLDGVEVNGKIYYTLPKEYTQITISDNRDLTSVSDGSWNEDKKVNSPQLLEGMTPVYWDEEGNEQLLTSSNQANWNEWYDYYANKWANAKTEDGSYWVWIPRYEYKIDTPGTATASSIYINFIKTSQIDPSDDYDYIHPSFTDGRNNEFKNGEWDEEIPGFWVSKYMAGFQASSLDTSETLANGDDEVVYSNYNYTSFNSTYTTNALGQTLTEDGYNNEKISYPVFKPLTYVYNIIGIGDCYTISKDIAKAQDVYGLNSKNVDSHLIKNSEFGAVLYLTYSVFGREKAEVTQNSKNINNATNRIYGVTGYSTTTALGVAASSTNNMSGVFDLKGCSFEFVSGYLDNGNDNLDTYGKSLTEHNETNSINKSTKYVTLYPIGNTDTSANNYSVYKNIYARYGDATTEVSSAGTSTNSWGSANSIYPTTANCFFSRASAANAVKGMFSFSNQTGAGGNFIGFRTVLIGK